MERGRNILEESGEKGIYQSKKIKGREGKGQGVQQSLEIVALASLIPFLPHSLSHHAGRAILE